MSPLLDSLRAAAPAFVEKVAWPMLWQSSLLIGVLFLLDSLLRHRLRPAIRYGFWLVLLVKLLLPPSLALPTGLAWWLRSTPIPEHTAGKASVVVTYGPPTAAGPTAPLGTVAKPPAPSPLPASAWLLLLTTSTSLVLLGVMLVRWRQMARLVNEATAAPRALAELLQATAARAGITRRVRLKLSQHHVSPALCGFFRPVVLLPGRLADTLSISQLQAVLLHELVHFRRRDVWVNTLQALLQLAYWWHPLLWFANSRIRRLREQAVDDAVMLALRDQAATYAPTLLEVAKLALARPLASLGLVGIFESRTALRERILRLEAFRPQRKSGLTLLSAVGIFAFGLAALPMGNGPARSVDSPSAPRTGVSEWPDPRFGGYSNLQLRARFFVADEFRLPATIPGTGNSVSVFNSNELAALEADLQAAGATEVPNNGQLQFQKFSGGHFIWTIGGQTNSWINYQTRAAGARTIVIGAEARFAATQADWVPMELHVIPWQEADSVRCQVALKWALSPLPPEWSEAALPAGGALLWRRSDALPARKVQLVVLENSDELAGGSTSQPSASDLPSVGEPRTVPSPATQADALLQEGKLLFALGKLSEAETVLKRVIKEDPTKQAADHYLNLIREAREKELRSRQVGSAQPNGPLLLQTNSVLASSQSRRVIYNKLTSIRLPNMSFDHLPLGAVLAQLNTEVKRLDPDGRGVTFTLHGSTAVSAANGQVDPATGMPVPEAPASPSPDISQLPITILPSLTDVRVADLLDAVVKVAPSRIKYSIQDAGVVFSARLANEPPALYTRVIKVDPEAFMQGVAAGMNTSLSASDPQETQREIKEFFTRAGIDLEPPKAVFYNAREGSLMVRATRPEVDRVEQAVIRMNVAPPQIRIAAKFIEVPPGTSTSLMRLELGLAPPGKDMVAKVLTPTLVATFLKIVESDTNVNLLSEARVETRSGRQAQVQVVEVKTVVMGIDPKALTPPGVPGNDVPYITTNMTFGPILDIIPYLAPNGSDIELTAVASVSEFLGYDKPDQDVTLYTGGKAESAVMPLPHIRLRKLTTPERLLVPRGHSLLLANPVDENGRPIEAGGSIQKSLFVLITPTLVDSKGQAMSR